MNSRTLPALSLSLTLALGLALGSAALGCDEKKAEEAPAADASVVKPTAKENPPTTASATTAVASVTPSSAPEPLAPVDGGKPKDAGRDAPRDGGGAEPKKK